MRLGVKEMDISFVCCFSFPAVALYLWIGKESGCSFIKHEPSFKLQALAVFECLNHN